MKKIYITNDEYERAEYEIYNDIPLSLASNFSAKDKTLDEGYVKEVLIEGEEWISIEEKPYMVLTSYSRMINTHSKRIIKPAISTLTIYWTVSELNIRSSKEFKNMGGSIIIRNNYKGIWI